MRAIEALTHAPHASPQAIEAFLAEHSFPIIEGRAVTFVFQGMVHGVFLQHWVKGLEQQQPFHRLHGTDLWHLTLDLPHNSRIEYKIGVEAHAGRAQLIQDPLNPHFARDPYGANSVVHTEGYEVPAWTQPDPHARPGEIHEHTLHSAAFGDSRDVKVYVPARYRASRRYPLLIVHDGDDFLRFANLQVVLDNLIHRLEIPPLICALITSPNRLEEYAANEAHTRFLVDELVPEIASRYSLREDPGSRGLLGASFGAVAALAAAWQHPGAFQRLCLLSGSFLFTDVGQHEGGPAFDRVVEFINAFRREPGLPARQVFAACGIYEPMIYYNRSMVPVLLQTGTRLRFVEAGDGHNWENWRDRLREGLSWLFPGPLWMVYE